MHSRSIRYLLLSTALGSATPALAQQNPDADESKADIVVTGQKVARSLFEVQSSVVVFSGEDLLNGGFNDLTDTLRGLANLNVTGSFELPAIRGASASGVSNGALAAVSGARPRAQTFIDGVAQPYQGVNIGGAGIWDLDSFEVYRGSQATTQGRNSSSGAFVVTTRAPSFEAEAGARAYYGSENEVFGMSGFVSAPIVADQLAFRLSVDGSKGQSWIDYRDPAAGTLPYDPDRQLAHTVRAKILYAPSESNFSLTLGYVRDFSRRQTDDTGVTSSDGTGVRNDGSVAPGHDRYDRVCQDYEFCTAIGRIRSDTFSLDAKYKLSEALSVHFLSNYVNVDYNQFSPYSIGLQRDTKDWVNELRLAYKGEDRTTAVFGAYMFRRNGDELNAPPVFTFLAYTADERIRTYSVFGDANIQMSPLIDIIAGFRLERERQRRISDFSGLGVGLNFQEETEVFAPKLGFALHPAEGTSLGFTVQKSFNPGGQGTSLFGSGSYIFDKETAWTYEGTFRFQTPGRGLTLSASAFYTDWKNQQIEIDFAFPGDFAIGNAPSSRSYGLELEASAKLAQGLSAYAGLGLLNTRITSGPFDGQRFTRAPKTTASAGIDYVAPFGLKLGGSVRYVGDYYSQISDPSLRAGDYIVANVNASYSIGKAELFAAVNNVFNNKYLLGYFAEEGPGQMGIYDIGQPRMVMLGVRTNF